MASGIWRVWNGLKAWQLTGGTEPVQGHPQADFESQSGGASSFPGSQDSQTHSVEQRLGRYLHPRLNGLVARKVLNVLDMLVFLFGRNGTILISSIAFSFFVSIFPIIVLLLTLSFYLELSEVRVMIFEALSQFFPIESNWIVDNLRVYTRGVGQLQLISLVLIAWSGSTFFFALEAGLDSAYRVSKYRHFVHSQVLGTGMTVISGVLAFLAISLLAILHGVVEDWRSLGQGLQTFVSLSISFTLATVLFFILYFFLPNHRRKAGRVVIEAVFSAVAWLGLNYLFKTYAASWSLQGIYGPFYISMTLLLWAYSSGCVLLGSARLSADGFFGTAQASRTKREKSSTEEARPESV